MHVCLIKYNELKLSCDDYIREFNETMKPMRVVYCFDGLLKVFNNSYKFKKDGAFSILGIFKSKAGNSS